MILLLLNSARMQENRDQNNSEYGHFLRSGLLDFADVYHYHENIKQLKNEIKWNKRNQNCFICHVS